MTKRVRKAVLPVAGLGTRVLPGAKTTPKNLLNIVDRPILSYVVEEARAAGDRALRVHRRARPGRHRGLFRPQPRDRGDPRGQGQGDILAEVRRDLPAQAGQMSFIRQMAPLGLGHAVWCARDVIGDEPFAVMLPDMLMAATPPALAQCVDAYAKVGGNIIAVEPAPEGETHKYGIVALDGQDGRLNRMTGHGRETAARDRALEPVHLGPLHPASRRSSRSWRPRSAARAARSSSPTAWRP